MKNFFLLSLNHSNKYFFNFFSSFSIIIFSLPIEGFNRARFFSFSSYKKVFFSSDGIFSESFKFRSSKSREVSRAFALVFTLWFTSISTKTSAVCRVLKVKEERRKIKIKKRNARVLSSTSAGLSKKERVKFLEIQD